MAELRTDQNFLSDEIQRNQTQFHVSLLSVTFTTGIYFSSEVTSADHSSSTFTSFSVRAFFSDFSLESSKLDIWLHFLSKNLFKMVPKLKNSTKDRWPYPPDKLLSCGFCVLGSWSVGTYLLAPGWYHHSFLRITISLLSIVSGIFCFHHKYVSHEVFLLHFTNH